MPRGEDEPVLERAPRSQEIPPHRSRQERGNENVDLGARPSGVTTLTIVEGQVDHFVDDVLDHLPFIEQTGGVSEELVYARSGGERLGPGKSGWI